MCVRGSSLGACKQSVHVGERHTCCCACIGRRFSLLLCKGVFLFCEEEGWLFGICRILTGSSTAGSRYQKTRVCTRLGLCF